MRVIVSFCSFARLGAVGFVIGLMVFADSGVSAELVEPQFVIRTWDRRDGLPPSVISRIQRTTNGYLWVGMQTGLLRFDGARFKRFDPLENPFLRTNHVRSLLAEPGGALLVGTLEGLFRFEDGRAGAENPIEIGDHFGAYALAVETGGAMWAVTRSNEVVRIAGGKIESRFEISGTQAIRSIFTDDFGQVTVTTRNHVFRLKEGRFVRLTGDASEKMKINVIIPSHDGENFWVSVGNDVIRMNKSGVFNPLVLKNGILEDSPQITITVMMEDRLGRLWVGTRNGSVHCLQPDGFWSLVTPRRSRTLGSVSCLYEDPEGLIWVGTTAGILHQIKPRLFTTWSLPTTAQESVTQTICVANDGAVWVGTDGAGAYRYKDGLFSRFGPEQGLGNATVMAIFEDRETNLWFGTLGGLFRFENGKFKAQFASVIPGQAVPALFQDRKGDLWFGAMGTLIRKRGDELSSFRLGNAVEEFEIRAIAEGHNGELWIGTRGGGLFSLQNEILERAAAFPRPVANAIHCDKEGGLWIGTRARGLLRVQDGKVRNWTTADGLPSNMLFAIIEDDSGTLWFSSSEGVFGLSKKALISYSRGKTAPLLAIHIAARDVETWSAGSGQPAADKGKDGRLWFPVGHGILSFDPSAVMRARTELPVMIEEVVIDGKERTLSDSGPLEVLSGVRRLEFRYTIADLDAPGRLKFRYRLDGLDEAWVDGGAQRTAYYSHLPPGDYRFRVISAGSANVWTETTPLVVKIVPRLWERLWFQTVCAFLVLGGVGATVRFVERAKIRRKLERLQMQQTMEKERRRIAQDLHDDLGSGITEIMLLSELAKRDEGPPGEIRAQLEGITNKARQVATAMDEIVWTVNPKNDSLPDLASYLCDYAQEFLRTARIRCRIDVMENLPSIPVSAHQRHNLFMAVKEALNNAVKHSGASEVWLRFSWLDGQVTVIVEDNGHGFNAPDVRAGGNGLQNMQTRLQSIQGKMEFTSEPGRGTKINFTLPLAAVGIVHTAESLN